MPFRSVLVLMLACSLALPAAAQPSERKTGRNGAAQKEAAPPPPPPQQPQGPPPYEPQLLRLAEILGALHHLRTVCGERDGPVWRDRMAALTEAEAPSPERRDRLAGAFNASYRTWARSYRSCTPASQVAVERFLAEAGRISVEVKERYGP